LSETRPTHGSLGTSETSAFRAKRQRASGDPCCDDYVELVEKLSGRTVEAFFSDSHIDPDYSVEFFLLEPLPGVDESR
jgi:hypothetical protein